MPRLRRSLFQSPMRRPAGAAAFAAATALILALVVGGFVQAAAVTVGYRDFAYNGAAASRATSLPEQSKLWFNDGSWWGGLFRSSGSGTAGSHFDIFKFNAATQAWTNTTRIVDSRDHTHADYLWDGAHSKLYVVTTKSACTSSPAPPSAPCNDEVRVLRFSYNPGSLTLLGYYTPDAGFPVKLAGGNFPSADGGGNAVTIAKDSTGELYVAWTRDDVSASGKNVDVYWAHSNSDGNVGTNTDESSWTLKAPFGPTGALGQDDTAAVVAFGTKVGVYWTSQVATGDSFGYFSVHADGTSDGSWNTETVSRGVNAIDNQVNLKAASDGSVYAVLKTGLSAGASDRVRLFKRDTGGTWSTPHSVNTVSNGNTRAQLVLDEAQGLVYVLSSSGSTTDGTIYVKTAPLSTLTFPAGKGSTFIKSATDIAIDDVSTTKDGISQGTGLLAEATDHITFQFFHNFIWLQDADTTPPVGSESINGGAVFTASRDVTLSVPASDIGSGVALVRVSNFSSVDGGGVLNAGDATSFGWAPTVPWTLMSGDGGKTVYVQWADGQGNWSAVTSNQIWLDTTGPAGAVSIDSGASVTNSLNVTLDVTAVDAQTSTNQVRIANAATVDTNGILSDASAVTSAYSATKSWTLAAGADGSRTVYAQWQDSLGNWSSVKNDSITVDTTPPGSGSVSLNGGATFTHAVDRKVSVALSNPGGATQVRLAESVAGLSSATPVPYSTPIDFTLAAGPDGTRSVYVQWGDDAGNFSVPDSDSIILDLRNPVGTVAINGGATGVRSLAVTLTFPSSDTDIDQVTISNNPDMSASSTVAFGPTISWTLAGPLTNGLTKAVYVTFHDQSGNVSDSAGGGVAWSAFASTRVDLTRPVMSAPIISRWFAGTGFAGNGAPLHLNWRAASDTISGVGSYTVWVSRDSRAFTLVGNTAGPAINVIVAPGHSYRYRVAATDRAGNRSALILSPVIRPAAYQDNSRAVIYRGRWGTARSTLFYGGTDHWSSARSATATLRFVGRSVAWVAPTGLTRGSARVYADGRLVATISLRTPSAAYKRLVFARSWGRSATHTIRIVVLGTAGHPRVDLDTFLIIR